MAKKNLTPASPFVKAGNTGTKPSMSQSTKASAKSTSMYTAINMASVLGGKKKSKKQVSYW